jgi:hypothetical protein
MVLLSYRDEVVGVFVRFRAPLQLIDDGFDRGNVY